MARRSGALVGGVGVERGQEHDALGERGIKALHGEDAVHAVHAEPLGFITGGCGLREDEGSGLVVHGQEHELRAFRLRIGDLDGEVGVVAIGKGGVAHDLDAELVAGGLEGLVDALGVNVVVLPDDGDLGGEALVGDVLR